MAVARLSRFELTGRGWILSLGGLGGSRSPGPGVLGGKRKLLVDFTILSLASRQGLSRGVPAGSMRSVVIVLELGLRLYSAVRNLPCPPRLRPDNHGYGRPSWFNLVASKGGLMRDIPGYLVRQDRSLAGGLGDDERKANRMLHWLSSVSGQNLFCHWRSVIGCGHRVISSTSRTNDRRSPAHQS